MINVLIPIVDEPEKYIQILSQLSLRKDVLVFVGTTKAINEKYNFNMPNIEVKVYENGSKKEEILNALQPFIIDGKTVICRRPFTINEFNSLIGSNASIVFGNEQGNKKIKTFFFNIMQSLTSLILGVKTFDGDSSILCFDEDMSQVLVQVENFSYATRVDRWKGVQKETIKTEVDTKVKYENNKKNILSLTFIPILLILAAATITTCVAVFTKVTIISGLLLFCLDMICLIIAFFCFFSLFFNMRIGQKNFSKAKEVVVEVKSEKN